MQPLGGGKLGGFSKFELGLVGFELGSKLVAFGSGRDDCCVGFDKGFARFISGVAARCGVAACGRVGLSGGLGGMEQRPLGVELLFEGGRLPGDGGAGGVLPREFFLFLALFL